jgi:hypothetical protein
MENNKICSFFGHRTINITDELYAITKAEIEKSIALGCRIFYFGGYGEFDNLCHQIVTKIKDERAELHLQRIFCVPTEKDLRRASRWLKDTACDKIEYLIPKFNGWYRSIYFRNCAMIDNSEVIIFYAENRESSGAYKAYCYAKMKKGKIIVNLLQK